MPSDSGFTEGKQVASLIIIIILFSINNIITIIEYSITSFQYQCSYMVVNPGPFVKETNPEKQQFANEIFTLFERCYIKGQDQK